jgi:hypothetical protein
MMKKLAYVFAVMLFCCSNVLACEKKEYQIVSFDEKYQIIPINDGLLTELPGVISRIERGGGYSDAKIMSKRIKQTSLLRLLDYFKRGYTDLGWLNRQEWIDAFSPIAVQCIIEKNNEKPIFFKSKGIYQYLEDIDRLELQEVLRLNRAVYFTAERGIILYDLQKQPGIEAQNLMKEQYKDFLAITNEK